MMLDGNLVQMWDAALEITHLLGLNCISIKRQLGFTNVKNLIDR